MKFKNIQENEDGISFSVEASKQEVEFLVNFAVERLLAEGIISINASNFEQDVELRSTSH